VLGLLKSLTWDILEKEKAEAALNVEDKYCFLSNRRRYHEGLARTFSTAASVHANCLREKNLYLVNTSKSYNIKTGSGSRPNPDLNFALAYYLLPSATKETVTPYRPQPVLVAVHSNPYAA
jgi:hypothetical protein